MHALLDVRIDNYDVTEFQLSHVVEDLLATCLFIGVIPIAISIVFFGMGAILGNKAKKMLTQM